MIDKNALKKYKKYGVKFAGSLDDLGNYLNELCPDIEDEKV